VPEKISVTMGGFEQLPANKYRPLLEAVATKGPTVASVAASHWHLYQSGVFDGCDKDAILGHAVLAKGFGEDSGKKYFLIQNSWGTEWGENGHIRLLRREGDEDDHHCGTDRKPKEGLGCDGGPSEITVCGTCGMLYDSLIPQGAHLADTA